MRESDYNIWAHTDSTDRRHAVFSGVSGELVELSDADWTGYQAWVRGTRTTAEVQGLLERLVRARALVNDDTDELAMLRRRFVRATTDWSKLGITIITSMGCNFDCPYCFESKTPALLHDDVADAIVQLLDDRIEALNDVAITWYGGEPLIGKRQLLALAARISARCAAFDVRCTSGIVTNGWLLDGETAAELRAHGIDRAQVTVDGPPDVHDRSRPRLGGGPTFDRIVSNLRSAADHLAIGVRINLQHSNVGRVDELLALLQRAGLAGRISISVGHVAAVSHNVDAPSASFGGSCLTRAELGDAELAVMALAAHRGFATATLPAARATPCTAVHRNELIIGAKGEIWKCLDDAGNAAEQLGTIFEGTTSGNRLEKWLAHDPFADPECPSCIALPVCMGGCALYTRTPELHDNRCSTFRTNHLARVAAALEPRPDEAAVRAAHAVLTSAGSSRPSPDRPSPVPVVLLPHRPVAPIRKAVP